VSNSPLFAARKSERHTQKLKMKDIFMRKLMTAVKGAALVEYGILVGLIAVLAIGAVLALGEQINDTFSTVENTLASNMSAANG